MYVLSRKIQDAPKVDAKLLREERDEALRAYDHRFWMRYFVAKDRMICGIDVLKRVDGSVREQLIEDAELIDFERECLEIYHDAVVPHEEGLFIREYAPTVVHPDGWLDMSYDPNSFLNGELI